jgi:hypothetical protein
VTISPTNNTIFAGSSITLTCSVTIIRAIDITVMVNITWIQPNNGQQISDTTTNDIGITINNYSRTFDRAQLGRYACIATLIPLSSNSNLRRSISQQGVAQVFTGNIIESNSFCISKLD